MATFSPSPAPRRTHRPMGSPPPVVSRRTKIGSSRPTSRLVTPVRTERLSAVRDQTTPASGMDVDDRKSVAPERVAKSETIFAMSEQLSVSFHSNLPIEAKQALKNASKSTHHSVKY